MAATVWSWPTLPGVKVVVAILFTTLVLWLWCRVRTGWQAGSALLQLTLGGMVYLLLLTWQIQHDRQLLQAVWSSPIRDVEFEITSLPRRSEMGWRFYARWLAPGPLFDQTVAMQWYPPQNLNPEAWPEFAQGQQWRWALELKPLHGLAAPGVPWREANRWVDGVLVQASLRHQHTGQLINPTRHWRQQVMQAFDGCCESFSSYPLWQALTLGERDFPPELWDGMRHAGLNHVLSISGMHIGLIFQWGMLLSFITRRMAGSYRTGLWLCYGSAFGLAALYAGLAGFAIPTQRALWTLLLWVLLRLWLRKASGWQSYLMLVGCMLLAWPPLALSMSFYLTNLALLILLWLHWQDPWHQGWQAGLIRYVRYQWVFTFAMLPSSLVLFGGFAPWALLVNLLLLPYISFVLQPLLLLLLFLQVIAADLASVAWPWLDQLFQPLLQLLQVFAAPNYWLAIPNVGWSQALLLQLLLVLGWYRRYHALGGALLMMFGMTWTMRDSRRLWILDVGQGSALVVQTGTHAGLIDLGGQWGRWSATAHVLKPFLWSQGIQALDWVVISHQDNDHRGDPAVLSAWTATTSWYSNSPPARSCRELPSRWADFQLKTWQYPAADHENERSCVVWLQFAEGSLLVPGDLGQLEPLLVEQWPDLAADVLVLGHHGSASSSRLNFLTQVAPQLAIASAGYNNRFGHPATEVRARLSLLGIPLWTTAEQGTIVWDSKGIQGYRQQRQPLWLEKLFQETVSPSRNR